VARVLDLIEQKVAEADFFLNAMRDSGLNIFGFHCYFSAFLSASRSITFTLQAVMSGTPGFTEWYEIARRPLVEDSRARFFVQLRNIATKTGELGIIGGSSRLLDDRQIKITYRFDPELTKSLPEDVRRQDVTSMSRYYMKLLIDLVSDWEQWYYSSVPGADPNSRFSTPEELEEALGLPVGWTDVGLSNEQRMHILLSREPPPISFEQLRQHYEFH
jgi:hypothetical protein